MQQQSSQQAAEALLGTNWGVLSYPAFYFHYTSISERYDYTNSDGDMAMEMDVFCANNNNRDRRL